MTKATIAILYVVLFLVANADDKIVTRADLFAPSTDPSLNPERRYAELDLNGDGTNELVLSESVSLGGTGGLVYNLYLGLGTNRFRQIDRFLAGVMATEIHGGETRLWFYSHMSAGSGTIQYRFFDRKGIFQRSEILTIYPGDGGSATGNGIYQAIFHEETILRTEKIGASNKAPEDAARKRADPER